MATTKWCKGHETEHPIEEFGKRAAEPGGLHYYCKKHVNEKAAKARDDPEKRAKHNAAERERRNKPEVKAKDVARRATPEYKADAANRSRNWRAENPEQSRDSSRTYGTNHVEERQQYQIDYKAVPENAAKMSQYQANYYQEHAEEKKASSKGNRTKNAEKLRKKRHQFRISNPELVKRREAIARALRRARKLANGIVPFTEQQLKLKIAYWNDSCWVCGGTWTAIDHYKPLAAGGMHCIANLRPSCARCNSAKNDKWPCPSRAQILGC